MKKTIFLIIMLIFSCINTVMPFNLLDAISRKKCATYIRRWEQLNHFEVIKCTESNYPGYMYFNILEPSVMMENSDFDGAYLIFENNTQNNPLPNDVYAFWYTPEGTFISINGETYSNLQEIKPILKNWYFSKYFSIKFFLKNPDSSLGRYLLFLGVKNSDILHKFSWNGWITSLIVDFSKISFNYKCERFEEYLESINTLDNLWDFIKVRGIHWNNVLLPWLREHPEFKGISSDERYVIAQKCGTPCCGKPVWRLTCSDIANFIIEVMKRNKNKWGILNVWPLGIHADDSEDFNNPGGGTGFRHVVALAYLENGTWIIMDENAFVKGNSLKEVLENYKIKYNEHKRIKLHHYTRLYLASPFSFSYGSSGSALYHDSYINIIQERGILTNLSEWHTPGTIAMSWEWITKNNPDYYTLITLQGYSIQ